MRKKPNLFIIGEVKSGTTAMYDFLNQHPDIFMSKVKEPGYFCRDYHAESDRFNRKKRYFPIRTESEYLILFHRARAKVIGEASTEYLSSLTAPKLIHKFNPKARIIIMIREPVDLLYSWHSQLLYNGSEDETDFLKALNLEERRRKGYNLPMRMRYPSLIYYSERAKFTKHIKRYLNYFPREHIRIIIYNDFVKNNLTEYLKTLKWMGVREFEPAVRVLNPNKRVRWMWLKVIAEVGYIWKLPKRCLPKPIYQRLRNNFYKFNTRHIKRPVMDKDVRRELMKRYKNEVVSLSELIKRDLTKLWGYDKV